VSVLDLLRRTGSFIDSPRKRGRPRAGDRPGKLRGKARIAFEVYEVEATLPARRGAFMAAVRVVAERWNMSDATVRRYAVAHPIQRDLVRARLWFIARADEFPSPK
jgi:hypothetical protein